MNNNVIIGSSPVFKKVLDKALKIASGQSITTLIVGENGTGKELIARMIHENSQAGNFPFVDINCGAIPENLLESELFGYEKGAFTGAYASKQGLLELAQGGSVFLDEISDMPPSIQSKLLKTVESKVIRRVGGIKEIRISPRIIAASNKDLYAEVKSGKFREDLYYRLNVGQIALPPLRERGEDVILLARHFIEHYNREYDRSIKGLSPQACEQVMNYSWPGNVRQLQNAIARAVLIESEEWIDVDHLILDEERSAVEKHTDTFSIPKKNTDYHFRMPTKGIALEELEKTIILSALEKAKGNLSHAARLLKISRGKLRYRLEKLGISV